MSWKNDLATKAWKRYVRKVRRLPHVRASFGFAPIPFGGVVVTRKEVKGQRYLRDHRLPHSRTVAIVKIDPIIQTESVPMARLPAFVWAAMAAAAAA